jgi:polyhydroxyalkanoate synthesis regulator protein
MAQAPVLIKRYARSRLYDTARGRYVTLDELRRWRRERVAFVVQDAEMGQDARPLKNSTSAFVAGRRHADALG